MSRPPMTDAEMAQFLGITNEPPEIQAKFIAALTPKKRSLFEKMRDVELWDKGFGPRPEGVIVCYDKGSPDDH